MFNPNPRRPLTRRQTARVVVAVAILAWATQTLVQQWGYGAEPIVLAQNETVERFVPPAGIRPRIQVRTRHGERRHDRNGRGGSGSAPGP